MNNCSGIQWAPGVSCSDVYHDRRDAAVDCKIVH
jgi:hypothetical protein